MKELSQGFDCTTNDRMELLGVIAALEVLKRPCEIDVISDSQYVVNAFNQHWVEEGSAQARLEKRKEGAREKRRSLEAPPEGERTP